MSEPTPREIFLDSLKRCTDDAAFFQLFYDRFLATSPEVREKFELTDFDKQKQMLHESLRLTAGAISGTPEALKEMRERAETHSRRNLNIQPHLYHFWLESIISTANECDPEWNDDIKAAWQRILQYVVDRMIRFY